jgi:DNA-binding CsgD family transcriptional regulator
MELGREPSDLEVADWLDIPIQQLWEVRQVTAPGCHVSLDDVDKFRPADKRALLQLCQNDDSGDAKLIYDEKIDRLFNLISMFKNKRMARVMFAYFQEGMTMEEIANEEGVTVSRISQLTSVGVQRLRGLLSPGEQRIAESVLQGKTNKEVAAEHFVCEKTVKFHLTNIYRKTNTKSRAQLIVKFATPNLDFAEESASQVPPLPTGETKIG